MLTLLVICLLGGAQAYKDPNTANGRTAMVHLFEWNWNAIANECENFLGPYGFGGVQVSPPHEHRVIYQPSWDPNVKRPWYESYQPISYALESRRGTRAEFINMVQKCNAQGVRIYVDAVVNHMCGEDAGADYGSGGTFYDTTQYQFDGPSFGRTNFNVPEGKCSTGGNINSYNDANQVRNCNLVGLLDLDTSQEYVRQKIADYLNDLISIGVAGFRIDAAKHMWPGDLQAIFDKTNDLNTAYFPSNSRAFFYQEVIDQNSGEAVRASEYSGNARVTDFMYGKEISEAFRNGGSKQISQFENLAGSIVLLMTDADALVFIDNHDNQRGHGGGGLLVTHTSPRYYRLAVAFMLAYPHGFPRIMSSYYFDQDKDWQGPPNTGDENVIDDPIINSDESCSGGWVCEHRWRPIKNMVEWRNQAGNEPVSNWWTDGYQKAAFSRGNKAFIAINRDEWSPIDVNIQTGLPAGEYCNLAKVDYNPEAGTCTGNEIVTVYSDGTADIYVAHDVDDSLLIIHVGAMKSGSIVPKPTSAPGVTDPPVLATTKPSSGVGTTPSSGPVGTERTVIFIYKPTSDGQDLFVRGGIDFNQRSCSSNDDLATSNCAMPISHNVNSNTGKYGAWSTNDNYLDWNGVEDGQLSYNGQVPSGSPLTWTTNNVNYHRNVEQDGYGYTPLNTWGEHYWMLDVNMDCSKTENGWFELKGLFSDRDWENDRNQWSSCSGTAGGTKPYSSGNHFARCGYLNKFTFASDDCQIDNL